MFRRLFKNVLWQGKLLFSFLILCQMVNLAPFWSTLTIKNKSVIHTQLASQWNHFPDHEISVQSDKKIRLVSKSRLLGSLEKRIRSALNPILPGLGSSCWPLLVLLNAKIRFCCTEPSAARICKSLWVAVLSELMPKCGWLRAGAEKLQMRARYGYIMGWPLEYAEQSILIDLASYSKVKWAGRTRWWGSTACVSVVKSHLKPQTDNAQRPTQL